MDVNEIDSIGEISLSLTEAPFLPDQYLSS